MIETISTPNAPAAIGPYSQARVHNGIVYCSGQIALTPTGDDLTHQSIARQTEQAMTNLKAVLEAAGSDLRHVLKVNIFLIDMNDFAAVNSVYEQFFQSNPPARATVAVRSLPRGARVEIDCTAAQKS